MATYLSFVMTARNDDYGGDLLHRMQTCINSILTLGERHGLDGEILLVEWNPPSNEPSLREALDWHTDLEHMSVRIVTVPQEVHNELPNSDKFPLFEYFGKNTGIRRANGEYILSCNPDLVYSEELIEYLASQNLDPNTFYRTRRYDVDSLVPLDVSIDEQLAYAENNTYKYSTVHDGYVTADKSVRLRKEIDRFVKIVRSNPGRVKYLVTNPGRVYNFLAEIYGNVFSIGSEDTESGAQTHSNVSVDTPTDLEDLFLTSSGDFLLMHRDAWRNMNSYPELDTNLHVDSLGCIYAMKQGLKQGILEPPLKIYHQEHDRSARESRPAMDHDDLVEMAEEILAEPGFTPHNDESWGLKSASLESIDVTMSG
jgi:hypothetical protein